MHGYLSYFCKKYTPNQSMDSTSTTTSTTPSTVKELMEACDKYSEAELYLWFMPSPPYETFRQCILREEFGRAYDGDTYGQVEFEDFLRAFYTYYFTMGKHLEKKRKELAQELEEEPSKERKLDVEVEAILGRSRR